MTALDPGVGAGTTARERFEALILPHLIPSDMDQVMLAYRLAKYGHRGQSRDDGTRYFDHPRMAAELLVRYGVHDADVLVATLLHDVMEDTFILTWRDLEQVFGAAVCRTIKLVTKEAGLDKISYYRRLEQGTPQGALVKLADRAHNMSTLTACTVEKRRRKVAETRASIAPLVPVARREERYAAAADQLWAATLWFCEQSENLAQPEGNK